MTKHESKDDTPTDGGKGGKHSATKLGGKHTKAAQASGPVGNTDDSKRGRGLIDPDHDADRR